MGVNRGCECKCVGKNVKAQSTDVKAQSTDVKVQSTDVKAGGRREGGRQA